TCSDGKWLPTSGSIQNRSAGPILQISWGHSFERKYKDKAFLEQEYVQNQRSVRDIAKSLGCSHSTILSNLQRFVIPIRDAKPDHYKRGQVAYGRRTLRSKEIENKRELEVIAKIQNLRSQGVSYWKIAAILNSMNVPTKNRGSRWHPTTVMKILKAREKKEAGKIDGNKL
ncbi:MAG: recombinase family protein, partial [Bdellovibrio sp.]